MRLFASNCYHRELHVPASQLTVAVFVAAAVAADVAITTVELRYNFDRVKYDEF